MVSCAQLQACVQHFAYTLLGVVNLGVEVALLQAGLQRR